MAPRNRVGEYYLQIDFEKGSERPERVFQSMAQLIEAFQRIDVHLARSVAAGIEPVVILQKVEAGSIRTWLATILRSVDDESLKKLEWKGIVGNYLVKGKARFLRFLEGKKEIASAKEVEVLEAELVHLAQETEVRQIPAYMPIPRRLLLEDLNAVSTAVAVLSPRDRATAVLDEENIEVAKGFVVSEEAIDQLVTEESIDNVTEVILKVKKPDYLGYSMWEFRHEGHIIEAKISDLEWLARFQNREITIGPGDALRARLRTRVNYDRFGEAVSSTREIIRVIDIIRLPPDEQHRFWPE